MHPEVESVRSAPVRPSQLSSSSGNLDRQPGGKSAAVEYALTLCTRVGIHRTPFSLSSTQKQTQKMSQVQATLFSLLSQSGNEPVIILRRTPYTPRR